VARLPMPKECARRATRCRLGRQPAVTLRTADCCINLAVRELMDLDGGAARAAGLLGEAKQQRHLEGCEVLAETNDAGS